MTSFAYSSGTGLEESVGRIGPVSPRCKGRARFGQGAGHTAACFFEPLESRTLLSAAGLGELCPDLTADIGANLKLPAAVVAGSTTKVALPVEVRNDGDAAVARGQKIDVRVLARRLADGQEMEAGLFTGQSISGLKIGAVKKLSLSFMLPAGLDGDYQLVAQVDAADAVEELNEDNNEAATSAASALRVAPPFVDLVAGVSSKAKLPTLLFDGDGSKISLPVEVTNAGNVPLGKGQTVSTSVYARRMSDGDMMHLADVPNQSISGLRPGAVKTLKTSVALPAGLEGKYQLVAAVDSTNAVAESDETNNEAASPDATPIEVAGGLIDLIMHDVAGASWTYDLTTTAFGRSVRGTVTSMVFAQGGTRFLVEEIGTAVVEGFEETQTQTFLWDERADGEFLDERGAEAEFGSLSLTFDDLAVSPDSLRRGQAHEDESDGLIQVDPGFGRSVFLDATATVTTKLDGYQTVTVPAGTFDAIKITVVTTMVGSGDIQGNEGPVTLNMSYSETITYWAAPGIGIVKLTDKLRVSLRATGVGSETATSSETRLLRNANVPAL